MILQFLWCARCHTAFTFTGPRFEHAAGGKLAVRHLDCGALNELAPNGMSEDGYELWKVVGEARPVDWVSTHRRGRERQERCRGTAQRVAET